MTIYRIGSMRLGSSLHRSAYQAAGRQLPAPKLHAKTVVNILLTVAVLLAMLCLFLIVT